MLNKKVYLKPLLILVLINFNTDTDNTISITSKSFKLIFKSFLKVLKTVTPKLHL